VREWGDGELTGLHFLGGVGIRGSGEVRGVRGVRGVRRTNNQQSTTNNQQSTTNNQQPTKPALTRVVGK